METLYASAEVRWAGLLFEVVVRGQWDRRDDQFRPEEIDIALAGGDDPIITLVEEPMHEFWLTNYPALRAAVDEMASNIRSAKPGPLASGRITLVKGDRPVLEVPIPWFALGAVVTVCGGVERVIDELNVELDQRLGVLEDPGVWHTVGLDTERVSENGKPQVVVTFRPHANSTTKDLDPSKLAAVVMDALRVTRLRAGLTAEAKPAEEEGAAP